MSRKTPRSQAARAGWQGRRERSHPPAVRVVMDPKLAADPAMKERVIGELVGLLDRAEAKRGPEGDG